MGPGTASPISPGPEPFWCCSMLQHAVADTAAEASSLEHFNFKAKKRQAQKAAAPTLAAASRSTSQHAAARRSTPQPQLRPLATQPSGELHVLWKDGHALGVDAAEVGVLEQFDEVSLRSLVQSRNGVPMRNYSATGRVAQRSQRSPLVPKVLGSNPAFSTKHGTCLFIVVE